MLARKPSPALLVSIVALVFAVSGIAIAAGPGKLFSKAETKKVKKLARAEANKLIGKRAAGLSVANAANAAALGGLPPGAFAQATSEPYREVGKPGQPQFEKGWANYSDFTASVAFYRDPLGVVRLRGWISSSVSGTNAFFLPPGYRPSASQSFLTAGLEGPVNVGIGPDGGVNVSCAKPPACNGGLDGVTFRAEQ